MQSEQIGNLAAALAKAQGSFKPIIKNKTVKVKMKAGGTYEYSYAPLDEVLNACRVALSENGLAIVQRLDEGENGTTLETLLIHESGEYIGSFKSLGQAQDPQQFGGKMTYFRRYQVSALLGVASEDDDDANNASGSQPEQKKAKAPAPKKKSANGNPTSPAALLDLVNSKTITDEKPSGYYSAVPHMFNAIKNGIGDEEWNWPAADNVDGWRTAYKLAVDHAKAPKEQSDLDEHFDAEDK